jgi:hypothetical protein
MRHGICAVLSCCERTPLQHSELRPVAYFAKWPAPMPVLVWATLDKIVPRGSKRRLKTQQQPQIRGSNGFSSTPWGVELAEMAMAGHGIFFSSF